MAEKLNKFDYKLYLILIKYSPVIIIISEIIYSLSAYYKIPYEYIDYIGSVSILFLLHLYVASYVFKFCYLYRLTLHFIVIINIIATYDTLIGIQLSDLNTMRMYLILSGCGLLSFIKFKIRDAKHNKRSSG